MPPPMSMESQTLLKLLADGRWHPFDEILNQLGEAVAPGKALRRYDNMEQRRVSAYGPRKNPELPDNLKIASGRRSIASEVIHSLRKHHVDVEDTVNGRMIRKRARPSMDDTTDADPADNDQDTSKLADLVADEVPQLTEEIPEPEDDSATDEPEEEAEDEPAADRGPEMALFREDEIRAIIRDEVTRVLDAYEHTSEIDDRDLDRIRAVVRDELTDALDYFQKGMQDYLGRHFWDLSKELRHATRPPRSMRGGGGAARLRQ